MVSDKWDTYLMGIAAAVSQKSPCLSRKIGSILVRENSILATGFNGPARGVPHCDTSERRAHLTKKYNLTKKDESDILLLNSLLSNLDKCPRQVMGFKSGEYLDWCQAVHSEANCIANAARLGVSTKGSTLYMNTMITPCKECSGLLINAGVVEVVSLGKIEYTDQFNLKNCDIAFRYL